MFFWFFYKEVTYIHTHYIIDTFSVVGSVPTPLNDLQSLLGMLSTRLFKIWLSSVFRTHSILISSLNWSRLTRWDSCSCNFIHPHTFSIGLRSGLLPDDLIS
jgi:hypothetical protein